MRYFLTIETVNTARHTPIDDKITATLMNFPVVDLFRTLLGEYKSCSPAMVGKKSQADLIG